MFFNLSFSSATSGPIVSCSFFIDSLTFSAILAILGPIIFNCELIILFLSSINVTISVTPLL